MAKTVLGLCPSPQRQHAGRVMSVPRDWEDVYPSQPGLCTLHPPHYYLQNVAELPINVAERGRGERQPSTKDLGRTLASTSEVCLIIVYFKDTTCHCETHKSAS